MATVKSKAKSAPKKAAAKPAAPKAAAKSTGSTAPTGSVDQPQPGSAQSSTGNAGNVEAGSPREKAVDSGQPTEKPIISPEEAEIITQSNALTTLAVNDTGIEIAPGISMLPSLRIAASLIPLKRRVADLVAMAERAVITDPTTYAKGVKYLSLTKETGDQLENYRVSVKRPIDDYSKYIQSLFKPTIDELAIKGKQIVSGKMLAYQQAEEQKAREAQEAQRKRQKEEADALAAQKVAEGKPEEADAIRDAAAAAPAPPVQTAVSNIRVDGSRAQVTKTWQGNVVNPMEALKAIIEGRVPITVIEWSASGLNAYAKSIKVKGVHNGIDLDEKSTLGVR